MITCLPCFFSPTKQGILNLEKEGFSTQKEGKASVDEPHIFHCGDIMYDNSMYFGKRTIPINYWIH